MGCVFCDIINKKIPAERLYEDENCIVIRDIDPKAPLHFLLLPKAHYAGFDEIGREEAQSFMQMILNLSDIVAVLGFQDGYRLIINRGEYGGQSVMHLHVHILGGKQLSWNPA